MKGCVFCRIIERELPSRIVFEDESILAIEDINPQAPIHILIMPKRHYSTLPECDDAGLLGRMVATAKEIARERGVEEKGYRLVMNINREGGQTVFHLHMHLLAGRPLSGKLG